LHLFSNFKHVHMLSEKLKMQTKHLHASVEKSSPLFLAMRGMLPANIAIESFKETMQYLWREVATNSIGFQGQCEIEQAYTSIYGLDQSASLKAIRKTSEFAWWGKAYVLLGSAMGSKILIGLMRDRGAIDTSYFEHCSSLDKTFFLFKQTLDQMHFNSSQEALIVKAACEAFTALEKDWTTSKSKAS